MFTRANLHISGQWASAVRNLPCAGVTIRGQESTKSVRVIPVTPNVDAGPTQPGDVAFWKVMAHLDIY